MRALCPKGIPNHQCSQASLKILFSLGLSLMAIFVSSMFYEPFITSKWIVARFLCILTILFSCTKKYPANRSSPSGWLLVFMGFIMVTPLSYGQYLIASDRLLFWTTVFASGRIFYHEQKAILYLSKAYIYSLLAASSLSLALHLEWFQLENLVEMERIKSSFGNISMFCAFLIGSFPLILFVPSKNTWLSRIACFIVSGFVIYSGGRSSQITLCILLSLSAWQQHAQKSFKSRYWILLVCLSIMTLLWVQWSLLSTKIQNNQLRLEVLKAALSLISKHPFGIGSGNFSFRIMEFLPNLWGADQRIFYSPHNTPLRWIVEEGVYISSACVVSFFLAFRQSLVKPIKKHGHVILGMSIVLMIELIFQQPFLFGFGFWYSAVFMGLFLSSKTEPHFESQSPLFLKKDRVLMLLAAFLFSIISVSDGYIRSKLNSNFLKTSTLENLCSIDPTPWLSCQHLAQRYLNTGHAKAALALANAQLKEVPRNWSATRVRVLSLWDIASLNQTCSEFIAYKSLIKRNFYISQELSRVCDSSSIKKLPL